MNDLKQLFARQAEWQKSRQALSWPEKIRIAERIRGSVSRLRVQTAVEKSKRRRVEEAR